MDDDEWDQTAYDEHPASDSDHDPDLEHELLAQLHFNSHLLQDPNGSLQVSALSDSHSEEDKGEDDEGEDAAEDDSGSDMDMASEDSDTRRTREEAELLKEVAAGAAGNWAGDEVVAGRYFREVKCGYCRKVGHEFRDCREKGHFGDDCTNGKKFTNRPTAFNFKLTRMKRPG
ncbi:hypothetical protein HDU96_008766 [Phlyctochytrium bullatum]|nr:hypothetical protein HDU96_008766 [Phlyctochytrium bullatum]